MRRQAAVLPVIVPDVCRGYNANKIQRMQQAPPGAGQCYGRSAHSDRHNSLRDPVLELRRTKDVFVDVMPTFLPNAMKQALSSQMSPRA